MASSAAQLAACGRPSEATLAALREATTPHLPHNRAIALLKKGRGDVSWAANFYWEDTEAHAEEEEQEEEQDEEEQDEEDEEEDALGGLPDFGLPDHFGSRTPEQYDSGVRAALTGLASGGAAAFGGVRADGEGPQVARLMLPAPVDAATITASQISQLQEVTKENLSDGQMRSLLAKAGGHVNIAVELYFADFDAAQNDLRKRGLPVHTDRSPQRKRLSAEELKEQEATYARVVNGEDDDVEIVGTKTNSALVAMPHARCSCPTVHFIVLPEKEASERVRNINSKTCDKCYCWVCDVLASECTEWSSHCMAFDRDPTWKKRRTEKKTHPDASAAASTAGATDSVGATAGATAATASAASVADATGKPKPECTLPGWTVAWSSEHSEWFFWNAQTKVSTWIAPTAT